MILLAGYQQNDKRRTLYFNTHVYLVWLLTTYRYM